MDRAEFDKECPADFQSAEYLLEHGQLDMVISAGETSTVDTIVGILKVLNNTAPAGSGMNSIVHALFCVIAHSQDDAFLQTLQPLTHRPGARLTRRSLLIRSTCARGI